MNLKQKQIHERAVRIAVKIQDSGAAMIGILQEADRHRVYRCFELSNLLEYAISFLKLAEPRALEHIAVARKSVEVPLLKAAIDEGRLPVSGANRLVSTITKENAAELIDFAATHTWRENERELANRNPRAASPDKVKMLGNGLVQLTLTVSEEEYKDFERACSVEAQRKSAAPKRSQVFVAAVQTHLDKYDPVRKAERAQKKSKSERSDHNNKKPNDYGVRIPLTAEENHAVHLRDQGRCTYVNERGERCKQDRWTRIHHIGHVSQGGSNDPSNLTTLCYSHHDLVHQLSLPLEGQINWLRDRVIPYRACGAVH